MGFALKGICFFHTCLKVCCLFRELVTSFWLCFSGSGLLAGGPSVLVSGRHSHALLYHCSLFLRWVQTRDAAGNLIQVALGWVVTSPPGWCPESRACLCPNQPVPCSPGSSATTLGRTPTNSWPSRASSSHTNWTGHGGACPASSYNA